MVNYQNGKIYKITSKQTDKCYIGSTTQELYVRLLQHKRDYKQYILKKRCYITSYEIVKFDDAKIYLIESYPCNTNAELITREQIIISETKTCVNKVIFKNTNKKSRFVDYKNGKIYKISSNETDKCYIGSTAQPLNKRLYNHRSNYKQYQSNKKDYTSSFEIIKYADNMIELLEAYPCNNKDELLSREGEWIKQTKNCVNMKIPGRSAKQYRKDNQVIITKKKKTYYEKNKNMLAEQSKIYREKNKEIIKEKKKKYSEQNKEKINNKSKKYYEKNKKLISQKSKENYEKNKSIINKRNNTYRENNKEKIKQYHENNKEKIKEIKK